MTKDKPKRLLPNDTDNAQLMTPREVTPLRAGSAVPSDCP
jgi:hypothetical protein